MEINHQKSPLKKIIKDYILNSQITFHIYQRIPLTFFLEKQTHTQERGKEIEYR